MLIEIQKDLLKMDEDYVFVHCISSDWAMGAGIAEILEKKYHIRAELNRVYPYPSFGAFCPWSFPICSKNRIIINLVTKKKYYQKPTLSNLKESLEMLKRQVDKAGWHKIAMPRIGCGLDKLRWGDVKELLEEIFDDKDEIVVCHL